MFPKVAAASDAPSRRGEGPLSLSSPLVWRSCCSVDPSLALLRLSVMTSDLERPSPCPAVIYRLLWRSVCLRPCPFLKSSSLWLGHGSLYLL